MSDRYEKEKIEQREDNKEKHNEGTLDEIRLIEKEAKNGDKNQTKLLQMQV